MCMCVLCAAVQVGDEGMSLEALADAIQVDPSDIVRTLFMKGIMLSLNQVGDAGVKLGWCSNMTTASAWNFDLEQQHRVVTDGCGFESPTLCTLIQE